MNDCSLRIYLFSAVADQPLSNHTRADVAFPAQNSIEIRVNGGDVKANYRGLKGKPGTTRPVDITDQFFRFSAASMKHTFSITYALTSQVSALSVFDEPHQAHALQKYKVHVCVVKRKFVEELVEQIVKGSVITKQRVIDDSTLLRTARLQTDGGSEARGQRSRCGPRAYHHVAERPCHDGAHQDAVPQLGVQPQPVL